MKKDYRNSHCPLPACTFIFIIMLLSVVVLSGCGAFHEGYRAGYDESIGSAKEAMAVQSLKAIALAQQQYQVDEGHGSYGTFEQLAKAGLLDERFASNSPIVEDYKFTMQLVPVSGNQRPVFKVNADPHQINASSITGKRHFYMGSDASIHVNDKQIATAQDPLHQP
jgi:hypothetical protein